MRFVGQLIAVAFLAMMTSAVAGQTADQMLVGSMESLRDQLTSAPGHAITIQPGEELRMKDKNSNVTVMGGSDTPIRIAMSENAGTTVPARAMATPDISKMTPEERARYVRRIQEHQARIQQIIQKNRAKRAAGRTSASQSKFREIPANQIKHTSTGLVYTADDGTTRLFDNIDERPPAGQKSKLSPEEFERRKQRIQEHQERIRNKLAELRARRDSGETTGPAYVLTQDISGARHTSRPNVLILFADDMRADTIHALGNDEIITPNLDALAASGVAFPHNYVMGAHGGAVCVASRAMLLTGRGVHHLKGNGTEIPETDTLLGALLQRNGYQAYGIGKWHNSVDSYMRSFEDGDEILLGGMVDSQYEAPLNHYHKDGVYNDQCMPIDESKRWQPKVCDHVYKGKHTSQIFADAAIKFLDEKRTSSPFFLYVAFTAPHDPRESPPEYRDRYDNSKISLPPNFMPEHPFDNGHMRGRDEQLLPWPREPEAVKKEIADYYGAISYLDAQIGRVIESLKKSGQYENTIIVFAGDNGLALGQHGLMGKQSLYEHSIGVPMIWSGPGIAKDKKAAASTYLSDIYPTLCEILNLPPPSTLDGKSFAKNLENPELSLHDEMYFSFRNLQRAVTILPYKLIEYNVKGERHTQLFNLKEDPWETKNLAEKPGMKPVVERMREKLKVHAEQVGDHQKFWKGF